MLRAQLREAHVQRLDRGVVPGEGQPTAPEPACQGFRHAFGLGDVRVEPGGFLLVPSRRSGNLAGVPRVGQNTDHQCRGQLI